MITDNNAFTVNEWDFRNEIEYQKDVNGKRTSCVIFTRYFTFIIKIKP